MHADSDDALLSLPDRWEELVLASRDVRRHAYARYSNYQVGASLLAGSGKIFVGCNVENASYGLTSCAERSAVCTAVASGETKFDVVCISLTGHPYPCGSCRQVLHEFNSEMLVLLDNLDFPDGTLPEVVRLSDLLPKAFQLASVRQADGSPRASRTRSTASDDDNSALPNP